MRHYKRCIGAEVTFSGRDQMYTRSSDPATPRKHVSCSEYDKKYSAQVTVKKIQNLPAREEVNNTAEAANIEMPSRLYRDSYESAN